MNGCFSLSLLDCLAGLLLLALPRLDAHGPFCRLFRKLVAQALHRTHPDQAAGFQLQLAPLLLKHGLLLLELQQIVLQLACSVFGIHKLARLALLQAWVSGVGGGGRGIIGPPAS